jgi:Tol biopolymer transport system component
MKMRKRIFQLFHILSLILISSTICHSQESSDKSFGDEHRYLGQTPPGLKPEVFAPGIISGKYSLHGFPSFSPDGKEIYFSVIPPQIMFMKYADEKWSDPQPASFSDGHNITSANFSPDGQRLFYQSIRPGGLGSIDIWYVERSGSGWSEPKNLGAPVNSPGLESLPTFTKDGTIYFCGELKGAAFNRGIYRSRYINGRYQKPELLPEYINTKYLEIYPFIASDESYLLFCSTRPSMDEKNRRIYISFRSEDDSWSEPINLNEQMNFDVQSAFPYISPDSKYLFFTGRGDIYWVNEKIIEELKKEVIGE